MPTSYNGWPASKNPKAIDINPNWAPLGHRFPGGVKSGDVEAVFTYLVEQLHARVEPIDRDAVKDEWGWFFKPSANSPKLISCHSSGTAIDWNATRHPNGKHGTFTPAQVAEIRKIQAELSGVVRWLGDATGTPDEMHFEIKGTPAQAAAAAARLRAPAPSTPVPPAQENDMAYVIHAGAVYLLHNGLMVYIGNPKDIASGIPQIPADDGDFARLSKAYPVVK